MAHDIWSNRFYSVRNQPAWHRISIFDGDEEEAVTHQERTAVGVLTELFGEPEVIKVPLTAEYGAQRLPTGHHALIRKATPDDQEDIVLGVVGENYELITPRSLAEMWDNRTGLSVETMAFLKRGAKLFITGVLPKFDIKGDAVDTYLIAVSPMDGNGAASGHVSGVRVVCQNTLHLAESRATAAFRIRHYQGAANDLAKWLERTYQRALQVVETMKEAYAVLADAEITKTHALSTVHDLYKLPVRPVRDSPRKSSWEDVLRYYEYRKDWVQRARSTVYGLYEGGATGFSPAMRGTAWGLLNSVAEFETYRRGTEDSMALNVVTGDRARTIQRAYIKCAELVRR